MLAQVRDKKRTMLNTIWVRKHRWIGPVRHDELLCISNLMEGRMVGKPMRGRRRLQMLEDL